MELIDGKAISEAIKKEISEEVQKRVQEGKKIPHLAAILVGHDGGSETYVAHKVKSCEQVGFKSTLIRFEDNVSEEELLQTVEKLNNDDEIDGFVNSIYLYDDRYVITFNYKNKSKTVTFEEIESSSLTSKASPQNKSINNNWCFIFLSILQQFDYNASTSELSFCFSNYNFYT